MPNNLQIRPATLDDIPVILRLIRGLAEYEKASMEEVPATEETLRATLFGDRPQAEALIAGLDSAPVGFAIFFHNYSTWRARRGLYLEDLFVLPEVRGRGVGKALLVELARIALERNCARLEWSVLDWNTPAIDFYKSIGAVAMDEWTVYRLTEDAIERLANAGR